jgi:hypothetical protein
MSSLIVEITFQSRVTARPPQWVDGPYLQASEVSKWTAALRAQRWRVRSERGRREPANPRLELAVETRDAGGLDCLARLFERGGRAFLGHLLLAG